MQRVSAAKEMLQREDVDRIRRMKAAMPCGIIRFTCEKFPTTTFMNEQMKHLLGVTDENLTRLEYVWNNIFFMFPLEERERFREYLEDVNANESTVACNHSLSRCDGGTSMVMGWLSKVKNAWGAEEYQGAYIDAIPEYDEEQEEKIQELIRIISEVYDVVFTVDLARHTIRCIQGKRYEIFKKMIGIRMILEDAVKCWISRNIVKEDQDHMLKFWQELKKLADTREEYIQFRIIDREQKERTYHGTFVYIDQTRRLFCCQEVTKEMNQEIPVAEKKQDIFIRTFGYFEIFINNIPIYFPNEKAKELLALLVDRRGGFVTQTEAISCLWEDKGLDDLIKAKYRKVAKNLMDTLREHGAEDVVVAVNGERRIDRQKVRCDLYEYLAGSKKKKPESEFRGSYMRNYSWGEVTLGELENT